MNEPFDELFENVYFHTGLSNLKFSYEQPYYRDYRKLVVLKGTDTAEGMNMTMDDYTDDDRPIIYATPIVADAKNTT